MKFLRVVALILSIVCVRVASAQDARSVLTFDEAMALASANRGPTYTPLASDIALLRRSNLPSVRAEVLMSASRSMDFFAYSPLDLRAVNSLLSFDYPLTGRGLTRARIQADEAQLRRVGDTGRLDDGRFMQLVEVYGQL